MKRCFGASINFVIGKLLVVREIKQIDKKATPDDSFDTDKPNLGTSWAPHRIFNIGNSNPTPLMDYISAIENCIGVKANN